MPWKCYGVLTRNTLLRSANTSVRSTLVFQTSQAVRLKLMGHFSIFSPYSLAILWIHFIQGKKNNKQTKNQTPMGEGGEGKDLIIKKRTFYTELILPIDFFVFDGLGKMANLSWSALSHSQPLPTGTIGSIPGPESLCNPSILFLA